MDLRDGVKLLLVHILLNDTKYIKALAEFCSASECAEVAKIVLSIFQQSNTQLVLIKDMISYELHKHKDSTQNIFRSNSFASKLLGHYVRKYFVFIFFFLRK